MTGYWGELAREYWQRHLPSRYAALEDPDYFIDDLDEEASYYYAWIRDNMLLGVSPNNGTIGWSEFLDRVAWANQAAREIVSAELIYIDPDEEPVEA